MGDGAAIGHRAALRARQRLCCRPQNPPALSVPDLRPKTTSVKPLLISKPVGTSWLPNGPRISCGDFAACALSYVSFRTEAPVSCMRLLDGRPRDHRRRMAIITRTKM